ncbi:MAG TPA: cupin domain-containing protein [Gaiellaceae bacterium]|nr:cupin domain-containing protein [Gaiellaceae bacterium]
MDVQRWEEEPIEWLSPTIGRQTIHTGSMTLARLTLRKGALVPRHEHENEQIATVLAGRLRFAVGDEELVVAAGESVPLAPNVPHEVEALEDSVVLDVFSPVREDWRRGDDAYLRGDAAARRLGEEAGPGSSGGRPA